MNQVFKQAGNTKSIPIALWLFVLIAVSLFVGMLMYLDQYEKGRLTEDHSLDVKRLFAKSESVEKSTTDENLKGADEKHAKEHVTKPSFDFYSLLPKMEVLVPDSEVTARSSEGQIKSEPGEKGQYYIQAGAFKDMKAADRMKAGLAMLGIQSKIVSVDITNSGTWHRVRVGPFDNSNELNKVRSLMQSNNIDSILVKVKT